MILSPMQPIVAQAPQLISGARSAVKYAGPSLALRFDADAYRVGPIGSQPAASTLAGLVTFTRASGGGRFNASGVYEWLGNDVPRLDYDPVTLQPRGILIEEQRTNLLTYSEQFDNAIWTKSNATITPNAVVAPDGTPTGDSLIVSAVAGEHRLARTNLGSTDVRVQNTLSIYVKNMGQSIVRLYIRNWATAASFVRCTFNLTDGSFSGLSIGGNGSSPSARIDHVGNGWYRCALSGIADSAAGTVRADVFVLDSSENESYTGDGYSGIYIWGAQLEAGEFPTSYIPTEASQVTRSADVASVNTLSPWYNPASGTFVVDHDVPAGRPVLSSGANIIATSQGPGRLVVAYDAIASYVSHNGSPYITGPALVFSSSIDILRSPSAYANARGQRVAYYPRVLSVGDV